MHNVFQIKVKDMHISKMINYFRKIFALFSHPLICVEKIPKLMQIFFSFLFYFIFIVTGNDPRIFSVSQVNSSSKTVV